MTKMLIVLAVLAAALIAAGCGGDDDDDGTTTEAQAGTETQEEKGSGDGGRYRESPSPDAKQGTTIKLASSPVGDALFDDDDQAIYLFDVEDGPESECYDDCAAAWPPVLTKGDPAAEGPIEQDLLGTTKRDDGTTQVTYNGHPLYYYANEGPGELRCHNVPGFGGLWLALDETGNALS